LIRRNLENRLFKAEAAANATSWADLWSAQHRASLRARVKICDAIKDSLDGARCPPELSFWREKAAAELASVRDTPELRAADEALLRRVQGENDGSGALERIKKRLDRMADEMNCRNNIS